MKRKEKIEYVIGDVRMISKFLFLPEFTINSWKWLQFAHIEQQLKSTVEFDHNGNAVEGTYWSNIRFLD
jgi:hypothetical protein